MEINKEKFKIRVVGCFLEYDGKFLILHRLNHKSEGGKWGLPAGKIDPGETEEQAVVREVFEEIGFSIDPSNLEFIKKITWNFKEKIVEFTAYRTKLESYIEINVKKDEHQGFAWVTAQECYGRTDLMHGVHDLLEKIGYITKV